MSEAIDTRPSLLEKALLQLAAAYQSELCKLVRTQAKSYLLRSESETMTEMLGALRQGILADTWNVKENALDELVDFFNEAEFMKSFSNYIWSRHVLTLCGDDAEAFQKKLAEYLQE